MKRSRAACAVLLVLFIGIESADRSISAGPVYAEETAGNTGAQPAKAAGNWYDDLLFKDENFIFEFIRAIGYAYEKGADIGECVDTARRIKDSDDVSWYNEWLKTADRLFSFAQKMESEGDSVSAKEAYMRASNYYRAAGFFLRTQDSLPKALSSWKRSRESFQKALAYMPDIERVSIPYMDTTLPGYFMKTANSKGKTPPLLIVHTGFDGTGEELYFEVGAAALSRGYNCLLFEGPGQGEVIRIQKIPFRYDWEKVVTPVVDYALARPDVDPDSIALMGISMGGYLAPRAVAFEHRIKACVANGGVYDFAASLYNNLPDKLLVLVREDPEQFNAEIEKVMEKSAGIRWFFNNGMWTFQASSPADFVIKMSDYTLKDVAGQIRCDMLVIDGEGDVFLKGQGKKLYEALTCPKTYTLFTREETAQAHCQAGSTAISNEIIFNWLDRVFVNA
ncbi:alpha/beta hydrolase family protein [Candidatus Omnitrophota bacterium]